MNGLLPLVLIVLGSGALLFGARWLIEGATVLSQRWRLPRTAIGFLLVALGTSLPEFVVGILAALNGHSALVLGNILGSNMANFGLVLGSSLLIRDADKTNGRFEAHALIGSVAALVLLAFDGRLSRLDGVFLLVLGLIVAALAIRHRRETLQLPKLSDLTRRFLRPGFALPLLMFLSGIGLLFAGARFLTNGALQIGELLGWSELFIGLTIVAVATSLPELSASWLAATRGDMRLAVENVLGSNTFNILIVLGVTVLIAPVDVRVRFIQWDAPWLVILTLLIAVLISRKFRITRRFGFFLLLFYILYIITSAFFPR